MKNLVDKPKRIAVIPARGGSKRIPQKNLKPFLGKPMIAWPIKAILETGLFDSVYVSTENAKIAEVSLDLGAEVLNRDPTLADDFTHTTEVLKDAISRLKLNDSNPWIYKVYPTTPTSSQVIREFVDFTEIAEGGFSVSVARTPIPVQRALEMDTDFNLRFREPDFALHRTQDLEAIFFDAGKLYGGRKSDWLRTTTPLLSSPRGFEVPDWLSVDLDSLADWELAEYKVKARFGV